jgi:hypothetical protein
VLFFGWLLRIGLRVLRLLQGNRSPRARPAGPRPAEGDTPKASSPGWDEDRIEEADYEELP